MRVFLHVSDTSKVLTYSLNFVSPPLIIIISELKRQFSLLELFGLGFSIIGVVASMSYDISYLWFRECPSAGQLRVDIFHPEWRDLRYGLGRKYIAVPPQRLSDLYGCQWTVCAPLLTCIGLTMSELASMAPTSGGLYYWTFTLSSDRWRCFLSWIVGCESAKVRN